MKSTRRRCGVCCLNGNHHPRNNRGYVAWCDQQRTWPTANLKTKAGGRRALCERLGIDPRTLPVSISDTQADRWAVRCGWHPEQVWPGWCEAGLRYVDRVFIEQGGWRQAWLHLEHRPSAEVAA